VVAVHVHPVERCVGDRGRGADRRLAVDDGPSLPALVLEARERLRLVRHEEPRFDEVEPLRAEVAEQRRREVALPDADLAPDRPAREQVDDRMPAAAAEHRPR
jgi:hypothetical protein